MNAANIQKSTKNEDATMKEFDVFPSFVNDSLQFVRLVISLDAAYASNEE